MGKSKIIFCFYMFFSISCVTNIKATDPKVFNGEYGYVNEFGRYGFCFSFLKDSTFLFKQFNGLEKRYSKGTYKINGNEIVLNSFNTNIDDGIPPLSWKVFINERLKINKSKLIFGIYELKKTKCKNDL